MLARALPMRTAECVHIGSQPKACSQVKQSEWREKERVRQVERERENGGGG